MKAQAVKNQYPTKSEIYYNILDRWYVPLAMKTTPVFYIVIHI